MVKQSGRQRLSRHTIAEVFEHIDAAPTNGQRIMFHGHKMHMRSTRLLSFRVNGIKCVKCGVQGAFFAKKRYNDEAPHLNLYGFNKHGGPLLMTRDHVKPKAKGGTNHLFNSQTMCAHCNSTKGDEWGWRTKIRYFFKKLFKGRVAQ